MIRRPYDIRHVEVANRDFPADPLPGLPRSTKLNWFWKLIGRALSHTYRRNNRAHERENDIARLNTQHEVVEGVPPITLAAFGRPQVSAFVLVLEGLVLIDPPISQ
jgi:hypothetical protein